MKKHKPVKHSHRRALIAQKKSKGKFSKSHLPKSKTIVNCCGNHDLRFFFRYACKHCFARGTSHCSNCRIWK